MIDYLKGLFSKDMWSRMINIAQKEVKACLRNGWVIAIFSIFVLLSVFVSYFGAAVGNGDWGGYEQTIVYLVAYMEYMGAVLGIVLGFGAVVQEREDGSLELLMSYPLDRGEVIGGKFLGLWAVLSLCVAGGLAVGGVVIAFTVEHMIWSEYYLFILSSVLMGGVFLSLSLLCSTYFTSNNSSMAGSVFFFFLFNILWLFLMYFVAELSFGWDALTTDKPTPTWYFALQLINPVVVWYSLLATNLTALRDYMAIELGGTRAAEHPEFYQTWGLLALLVIWIAVPLLLAEYIINKKAL